MNDERTFLGPGIHTMSAEMYHSDPCPEPSLSSSIAKLLCLSSPAHAKHAHPRLNPQAVNDDSEKFDIGECAHALLLEGVNRVEIVDAKDWRTKAAQEARAAARTAGKIPLLPHVWADVEAMLNATRDQLDAHADGKPMFRGGKPEQTVVWQESDGTWCRARLDWLRDGAIDDYKSSGGSANPESWTRTLFALGFDIQAEWYRRGVKAVTGKDVDFRFCVQETDAPYALSVIALGPDAQILAQKKILWALETWRRCLDENDWPGYPQRTAYASLPAWQENWWLSKEGGLQ